MKSIVNNTVSLPKKIIVLFVFIVLFTGSDLLVKEIIYRKVRNNNDVVIIPGVFRFHYVTNDDIGFSALRWVNEFLGLPKKIRVNNFENNIVNKLTDDYHIELFKKCYTLDENQKYFVLNEKQSEKYKEFLKELLSDVGFRTSKWLFLVFLQGLGTIAVIVFFFYSHLWRYLFPLALIASGALGNVLDRIIRGYVVDFAMVHLKFIPLPIFNPWPIFNLADVYTVVGACFLFIILFFFANEDKIKAKASAD